MTLHSFMGIHFAILLVLLESIDLFRENNEHREAKLNLPSKNELSSQVPSVLRIL